MKPSRLPAPSARRRGLEYRSPQCAEVLEDRVLLTPSPGRPQDLVGFQAGQWVVSLGTVNNFFTNTPGTGSSSVWAQWANISWNFVGQGDFDGNGLTDVIGLFGGSWYVGLSDGFDYGVAPFPKWGQWANIAWQDIRIGDINGDGRSDIFARTGNQYYTALSNGATGFFGPVLAAGTGGQTYQATFLADVNADTRDDLVVFTQGGNWIVGLSNGGTFGIGQIWAIWDVNTPWEGLTTFDMNGDGRDDIVGFRSGRWQVGLSTILNGGSFNTFVWAQWSSLIWKDARIGDFDGNGIADVTARYNGQWWVGLGSLPGGNLIVNTTYWGFWSDAITWQDVRVGDFNGDGNDDIAGRYLNQWWVARSVNDNSFVTTQWGVWPTSGTWLAVATIQANNLPIPGFRLPEFGTADTSAPAVTSSSPAPGTSTTASAASASTAVAFAQPDPLLLFWSQANRDEEWQNELLASAL